MADFLASFDLGVQTAAPSNNLPCDSVDDLKLHLRSILDAKTSPTRAEHVSITMELRASVRFIIPLLSEPQNGDLSNIDPSLGGGTEAPNQLGDRPSGVVVANEALTNQPQDDPTLQTSVAKHIIATLGSIDGSTWTIREVTRGPQGWKFTYLCKDSFQQWNRQNAKHSTKAVVGDHIQQQDPILRNRPAFDCRGTIVIDFNRNSRAISVKYEHTPQHKTVADLLEYFKPPPRQLGPGAQRQLDLLQQKTPKAKRTDRRAQDENGNPRRKRKKKNDGTSQPTAAASEGQMLSSEYPAPVPEGGQPQPNAAYPQDSQSQGGDSGANPHAFSDYPEGLVAGELANHTQAQKSGAQPPPGANFPVNISPAEAARRREVALAMLTRAGVPPETLSTDQFNIFSNQSPELQKESLAMLAKYGAERLRIVHPTNKGGSASAPASTSPGQSSQATPSGPMTTKELVPQPGGSGDVDSRNGHATNAEDEPVTQTTGRSRRKPGKSRNACLTCKGQKVKCPREKPSCSECEARGLVCEYAPQKPRKKKPKSSEIIVDEPEEDGEDDFGQDETREEAEGDETNLNDASEQETPDDYSTYPQLPLSNAITPAAPPLPQDLRASHTDYFQPGPGLTLPQDEASSMGHHHVTTDPAHTYNPMMAEPAHHIEHQPVPAEENIVSPTQRRWDLRDSASHSRHNLPSESLRPGAQEISSMTSQASSDWNTGARNGISGITVASGPSQMSHSGTMNQRSGNVNHHETPDAGQVRDGMQAVSALAHAAIQKQQQQQQQQKHQQHQSPTAAAAMLAQARVSPFQPVNASRAKSRRSQRAQSRTPLTDQPMTTAYQPPPCQNQQARSNKSAHRTSDQMGGISKHGDYGRHGNSSTTASHQSSQKTAYEPYSQSQGTSSLSQLVDPPSRIAKIAQSMSSQAPSTMATSYQTTSSNQWSSTKNRTELSHSSTANTHNSQQNTYSQPSGSTKAASGSRQSYNTRESTQPTRSENSSFSQQQQQQQKQQNYSSYPPPAQHQQSHTNNQQPSWYNFNNSGNTNSFSATNQAPGYSWKPPDESWGGN
ncbi:ATP-dependent DNA helicase II subunit 1 [Neonectria punicea]|uniref:ATP-dependent DNA helicase II subunit 1 n=1 Tax=Neonectria punicea TaxID=979145 RepID=A0ABR1HNW1_9HYPO